MQWICVRAGSRRYHRRAVGITDIAPLIARIRATTSLPIAAGFGISTAAHVRAVTAHADGAIVGSAIVRGIREAITAKRSPEDAAVELVESLTRS